MEAHFLQKAYCATWVSAYHLKVVIDSLFAHFFSQFHDQKVMQTPRKWSSLPVEVRFRLLADAKRLPRQRKSGLLLGRSAWPRNCMRKDKGDSQFPANVQRIPLARTSESIDIRDLPPAEVVFGQSSLMAIAREKLQRVAASPWRW